MDEQYVLVFEDFNRVLTELDGYKTVHLIYDDFVSKKQLDEILQKLGNFEVLKSYFPNCVACASMADGIEYLGEQIVISVGGVHVSSLAKYYACSLGLDFAMICAKEISEFSFSEYAFLCDDYFCFYQTVKPKFVFLKSEYFCASDLLSLQKVLKYKNIVLFEKEFEHDVLKSPAPCFENLVKGINLCDGKMKSVVKVYGLCANMLEKNNVYDFLGAEYILLALLCKNNLTFLENLLCANNLLFKFFECFLNFDLACVEPDINLHIKSLKDNFKIYFSQVSDTISVTLDNDSKKEIAYRLDSYLPFLKEFFEKCSLKFVPTKTDMTSDMLSKCLALCADLFSHKSFLRLARDFGYFEMLLKK